MNENSDKRFSVQEISKKEMENILSENPPISIKIGGKDDLISAISEAEIEAIHEAIRQQPKRRIFLLVWKGGGVPVGAKILGHVIGWIQHGIVKDEHGNQIGTYDSISGSGNESGTEQKVIVYI